MWEHIRKFFAIDPNRSTGVPLNPQFRNPPPGADDPLNYDDAVTFPAADIADNAYWQRDTRRQYPQLSTVSQADVVGLLTVGSKAAPKQGVELIGEAGAKYLVAVKQEGEEKGLSALFTKDQKSVMGVLGPNGMPPLPTSLSTSKTAGVKKYTLTEEQGYPAQYVKFALLPGKYLLHELTDIPDIHVGHSSDREQEIISAVGRLDIHVHTIEPDFYHIHSINA